MKKPSNIITLAIPALLFLLTEVIIFRPKTIYVFWLLVNVVLAFGVFKIVNRKEPGWYNFFFLPLTFFNSVIAYFLVQGNNLVEQALIIMAVILVYYYLSAVYFFHFEPLLYKSFQIENISSYGNFLSVFFLSSSLFGIQSFLNWPIWAIMLVLTFFLLIVIYQINWAYKFKLADSSVHIFVDTLMLVELAWCLTFLPLRFNILGLVLSAAYYIIVGLTKHYLLNTLEGKIIKTYLGIGLFCVVIIFLSARWI